MPADLPWKLGLSGCVGVQHGFLSLAQETFPKWSAQNIASIVPGMDPLGVDLLSRMLQYRPQHRITARDALNHEYFRDLPPY